MLTGRDEQQLWWLFSPAPGQPDPVAPWEGGDDMVFETIDTEMRARASDQGPETIDVAAR